MAVVTFDPVAFVERYPEFSGVSSTLLQAYFDEATLIVNNTDCAFVSDVTERKILLWALVAHITYINNGADNEGASGIVGRISSASEGTVSVSSDYTSTLNSQWYNQTPYGAKFWQLTAKYRTMRYVPGRSWPARRYTGRTYGRTGWAR